MDILQEFSMQDCQGVSTPLSTTISLRLNDGSPPTDAKQYQSVIGKLQYLSFTRPDISFVVNKLSQFIHQPSHTHWQAVKCLLRYLKLTIHRGLLFHHGSKAALHVYSNADWAGDYNDHTSTSAYVIYLDLTPISWSSKKQRTVARSSTEAEYRAVAHIVAETNWLTNILKELHISLDNV
ncbi:hypothetical protein KY290_017936 [Solanum tuberosum]|uniref:Uncharacterized protein n=1 Tax=Solanum tuberosum TaxID=4113 RepID=A0ABQ7VDJ4_SOLTU|nr:hypothetical protein KY290_017936 [Solanum tuberosum]